MDAQTAPLPFGYMHGTTYNMINDDDTPVVPFEHHNADYDATCAELKHDTIEPLVHELIISDNAIGRD